MNRELMDMLRAERARLQDELKSTPTYRRLEAVAAMLEVYDDEEPAAPEEKADKVEEAEAEPKGLNEQIIDAARAAGACGVKSIELMQILDIGYDPLVRVLKPLVAAGHLVKVNNGQNGIVYIVPPKRDDADVYNPASPSDRIMRSLDEANGAGMKASALRSVSDLEPTPFKAMMDALVQEGIVERRSDRYFKIETRPLHSNGAQA